MNTPPLVDLLLSNSQDPKLLSSPQASSYLTHLTSLSLPLLLVEPQKLSNDAGALTSQLTNLCTTEYPTFLSLHSTAARLSERLDSFTSSLDSLLDTIPALDTEIHAFGASTKTIQVQRRKAGLVLEQHDKLLDVLQIPQLIDTCVRNGYYGEAMDLSAHTTSLLARFPTVPIINDVAAEAEQAIKLMFSQLLTLLREPAKLPALSKAINFLRRMGSLDEEELALAFLTSRAVYLEGMFASIDVHRSNHVQYLRGYVDVFREAVYDIVTQYTTIFLDRATVDTDLHETLLHFLQTYTHTQVMKLITLLRDTVPQIDDPTSLTSLLTQLTYCATSFARIGLDFQSLLHQPFTDAILNAMTTAFSRASAEFETQLDQNTQTSLSTWLITPALLSSLPEQSFPSFDDQSPIYVPPSILSSFPPLAIFTNAILTALNSLRLLAPVLLLPTLSDSLEVSLAKVGRALLSRATTVKSEGKGQSEDNRIEDLAFNAVGTVYLKCLVPFATRALVEGVYQVGRKQGQYHGDLKVVEEEWKQRLSSGKDDVNYVLIES